MVKKLFRQTFTYNGTKLDKTFSSRKLASQWYESMKAKAEREKVGLPQAGEALLFSEAAARYILLRQKSADYWMQDEAKFRKGLVPELGKKSLRKISKGDCEVALHTIRQELNLSGATFNRYRMCLHTFFEYAIDQGFCDLNPVSRIKPLPEMKRGAFIPDAQIMSYLSQARLEAPWFFPFVVFAMNAGPRTGELLGFFWSDYRPELQRIEIVRRYQTQLNRLKEGTKGGGGRVIPLNDFVIRALEEYRAQAKHTSPSDLIFCRDNGERVSTSVIGKIHRRCALAAGVPSNVRLYDITRHKFASAVTQRFGLRMAQALLGHSSSQTTERYAHDDPGHLINQAVTLSVGDEEKVLH